jgi:CRP-like cAMP-binding protein
MAGAALGELAERGTERSVTGELFACGDPGDSMFVVVRGTLLAERPGAPPRPIPEGSVVGELAVLTRARRAATLRAADLAEVIEIDRASFTAVARRAPEVVLGLSATLAGWLVGSRPDVLP